MKFLWVCLTWLAAGLMVTSVAAMDICVQENGGCKDLRTGTVYRPEGNKLIDPKTKRVFMENPPVQVDSDKIQVLRGSGSAKPVPPRDPVTGRIIQGGKRVGISETEVRQETITIPGRRVHTTSGLAITSQGVVPVRGFAWIPPSTEVVTTTRTYTRATTCSGLKDEIAAEHRKWSKQEDWNRAEVGEHIDKLEGEYRENCR